MIEIQSLLTDVQKPARYTGGEVNSVKKTFSDDTVKVAISYPDMYEIGMSYLGLKIIYHMLNEMDGVLCERVFMPAGDMIEGLRKQGKYLFSLESRNALRDFDILGFSLSYELTYTNVLAIMDLGGVSVRSRDRKEDEPLVIAGGVCALNPEPMSDFIDAFLLGDAEDLLPDFIKKFRYLRDKGLPRKDILLELARIEGVYVPSLYENGNESAGCVPLPGTEGIPNKIRSAKVKDLDKAFYPVRQIVPHIRIVHDRIAVEVMRGCPNRCRFCQAGAVNRPVRVRSEKKIMEICHESYKFTGMENIALLSLSSVNYPYLVPVAKAINRDFAEYGVGLSIPSLRVQDSFYELPEILSVVKKAGLTFAPESADPGVIKAIAKDIDKDVLLKSVKAAFEKSWRAVKLYFMVGFPQSPDGEEKSIVELAKKVSSMRGGRPRDAAEVSLSVNPFIPKPHTPFQWYGMKSRAELEEKRKRLLSLCGPERKIKISFHNVEQSLLEGALARGDRRVSSAVYSAWKKGAMMDGWTESFKPGVWDEAFSENGLSVEAMATRSFGVDDPLPWGHIDSGAGADFLKKEFIDSLP